MSGGQSRSPLFWCRVQGFQDRRPLGLAPASEGPSCSGWTTCPSHWPLSLEDDNHLWANELKDRCASSALEGTVLLPAEVMGWLWRGLGRWGGQFRGPPPSFSTQTSGRPPCPSPPPPLLHLSTAGSRNLSGTAPTASLPNSEPVGALSAVPWAAPGHLPHPCPVRAGIWWVESGMRFQRPVLPVSQRRPSGAGPRVPPAGDPHAHPLLTFFLH